MKDCDIYLDFGNNTRVIVTSKEADSFQPNEDLDTYIVRVPESTKDDLSIEEIVHYMWNNSIITKPGDPTQLGPKVLGKVIADSIKSGESDLKTAYNKNKTKLTYGYSTFTVPSDTKVSLVPNTTIEELKLAYPEALKLLPKVDRPYNISWLKFVKNQGYTISGRVFANGQEFFVLRTQSDLQQFALTEAKRELIRQYVTADSILPEDDRGSALNDRYQQKLLRVVEQAKNNSEIVKRIKEEYGEEVNMKTVLLDYLYNKQSYQKLFAYQDGDTTRFGYMNIPLRDCINELNHVKVLYQDEESDLAAALRGISYNREKLGKKSLYELLEKMYKKVEFRGAPISRKDFNALNKAEMQELLQYYFKGDTILGQFEVEGINQSNGKEQMSLTSKDLQDLYKSRRGSDKTSYKKAITEALTDDDTENIELLKSKLGTQYKDENGETYNIIYSIEVKDGKKHIKAEYVRFNLTDDDVITIKYKGQVLKNLYENTTLGWDTRDYIESVNEDESVDDPVIDGKYHGYYIFKKSREDQNYFISRSVLFPDLYIKGKFKTLKAAKQAVVSYNSVSKVSKATSLDLKIKMQEGTETTYSAVFDFLVKPQQTVESLDIKFNNITEVNSMLGVRVENKLFNGKIKDVVDYYTDLYGAAYEAKFKTPLRTTLISMLDTPEKAGIFVLKMLDNRVMDINKDLSEEQKVDIIQRTLQEIDNAPVKQYLVKKVVPFNNSYRAYLSGWSDMQANVNAVGRVKYQDKDLSTHVCITKSLRNVMNYFNNTLFAGTNVKIQIVSTDTLTNGYYDKGTKWSDILGDSDKSLINGFVYNNVIYINQSNIKKIENTMYHEVFHIVLGAIRANNEEDYIAILSAFEDVLYDLSKKELRKSLGYLYNKIEKIYPKLARQDKLEEMVVTYLAQEMEQSSASYFGLDEAKVFDGIKTQLFKIFEDINSKVETALFSTQGGDSEFLKGFFKEGTNESMLRNQQATSLMEKSIRNGEIIEDCTV